MGEGVEQEWLGRHVVVHDVPTGLDSPTAVAAIGTGRTAAGVLDHAAIGPDDVVVVTSAAGGMGTLLLQGAHHAGARTVALANGPKLEIARRYGADTAIDYRDPALMSRLVEFEKQALAAAADGTRVPYVGSTFPLAEAAETHRALGTRAALGKVVLQVRP